MSNKKDDSPREAPQMEYDRNDDDGEHDFEIYPIADAKFVRGNASCERITRVLLYCRGCGKVIWENDPEQPNLEPSA